MEGIVIVYTVYVWSNPEKTIEFGKRRPETCGKERNFPNLFGAYYRYVMVSTPLKNMSSSVGMIIANIWKNKKCSKPPTKYIYIRIYI